MSALAIEGLNIAYGRIPILTDVSFALARGEFLGILGHNGVGKSTLIKCLAGHLPARGGRIVIDGRDVTGRPAHSRAQAGLGYVPQGRMIFANLTVEENLRIGALHLSDTGARARIENVLEMLPRLKPLLQQKGGSLSGGEQQILALGRALCHEPAIILLDEPTEGIQPSIVQEIAELLVSLKKQDGFSLIVVEQNLSFLASVAARVLVMARGRIVGEMSGADLGNIDTAHAMMMS